MLALDPTGSLLQMPLDMLQGTPFPNFLIPGLLLCVVLGLGAFFVLACLFTLPKWAWAQRLNPFPRQHWTWAASATFGLALMIWITVQVWRRLPVLRCRHQCVDSGMAGPTP